MAAVGLSRLLLHYHSLIEIWLGLVIGICALCGDPGYCRRVSIGTVAIDLAVASVAGRNLVHGGPLAS